MKKYVLLSLALISMICSSWGFLVHRTIHQLAVYELPKPMRPFFYRGMNYLVENAGRPDQRRNQDSTEAPRHFIDLEMYGDSAAWKMPFNWEDAVRKYSKDSLLKYGYVPYHIITMKNKLTESFRLGNRDSILFYATDLAHYIGDAHVPLHTSVNYDGQLTNQKGLHALWESMIPEIEIQQYNLHSRHQAQYLDKPEQAVWDCIRHAHILLTDVFAQETAATGNFTDSTKYRVQNRRGRDVKSYTSEFAKAYSQRLGQTINEQLLASADMIADFWYSSWVDAGRPDLEPMMNRVFTKEDKRAYKKEKKAYKRNELIELGLLIAKKQQQAEQ